MTYDLHGKTGRQIWTIDLKKNILNLKNLSSAAKSSVPIGWSLRKFVNSVRALAGNPA